MTMDEHAEPCDHCGALLHPDRLGWWVGEDETSECRESTRGHEVGGTARWGVRA
jgi:hypothetical protein